MNGKTGALYTSFAPAGDPPSQSSGTLMSLPEGIAAPRSHVYRHPLGRRPDSQTEPPQCLQPNLYPRRAVCGTSPEHPLSPPPRTLFPNRAPAVRSQPRSRTHYSTCPEKGRELVGEKPVCSVATSGCPKRSEDGFPAGARNIPPRPAQPNSKQKASYREVRGFEERLTGIEPAYQAWEACALPLSYSRIFFSVSRLLAGGEIYCGCLCAGRRG